MNKSSKIRYTFMTGIVNKSFYVIKTCEIYM